MHKIVGAKSNYVRMLTYFMINSAERPSADSKVNSGWAGSSCGWNWGSGSAGPVSVAPPVVYAPYVVLLVPPVDVSV